MGWEGERVEIGRSGVGEGESGDRQEWKGRRRAGTDRRSGKSVGIYGGSGVGGVEGGYRYSGG